MKTKPNILLQLLVLSALLLAASPKIQSPADAAQLQLSSECASNYLVLHWSGTSGVKLQQATNLANPVWLDVPGTVGGNSCALPMTNAVAYFRLYDAGSAQTTGYVIGSIPNLTVRNDTVIEFMLDVTASGGPPFTMTYSAGPAGVVTLATNGLFRYVPATSDKTPFTVTIAGGSGISQTFTINPQPILPPEYTVFGTGERTQLTNSVASDLIKLDQPSFSTTNFNYAIRTIHSISIISSGTNVIEQGNANNLYETYFTNRSDIKEMELMAECLIVRSPLILKQTKVTIHARELRFEGSGKIITTPAEVVASAIDSTGPSQPGGNGADGLPAGDVAVFVEKYTDATGNPEPKFDLTGGKGQDAGKGRHGVDGTVLSPLGCGGATFTFTVNNSWPLDDTTATYTVPSGWCVTRWRHANGSVDGVESWPTDGTPAWAPGTNGYGGQGGSLITSHAGVAGVVAGGQPGARGTPVATSSHWNTEVCEGGRPGYPLQSVHIYSWQSGVFDQNAHLSEDGRYTATSGISYPVPSASAGIPGTFGTTGNSYTWLNPQLLRKIINDAKDDYLQNRITAAESRLKNYAQVLESYQADNNAWIAAPEMSRFELSQMYNEIEILLQQIANGLDYFGNPNGWVPMLSFEVNANLFNQEIDRSLDIVYLSRWITRKQDNAIETFNALGTARAKLAAEIDQAKLDYDTAANNLSSLNGEAEAMRQRVLNLQLQLEAKDNELQAQADKNTRPPEWETGLRLGLKTAAVICQMVPVYQPALGAVGGALQVGSDFDPDEPWDSITGGLDFSTTYLNSQVADQTAEQKLEKDKVNTSELSQSSKRIQNLGNLSQASSALSAGIKDIRSFLEKSKAPSSHMQAELDRLRSTDPQYTNLVNDITQLMQDKRLLVDKIIAAINNVAGLSDLITRDILAIDGLSATIGANAAVIDGRVNAYLKDMERRAFDRLLKYHYYMAKAYEYRLVKPYNATLNLESLYNRMDEIATAGTNAGVLTSDQQLSLHSLFKDIIAATTESIIDDYNQNQSTPGTSFTFDLTASEIASLNRGEAITLNLVNEGFFAPWEENVRIADLHVFANAPSGITTAGSYGSPAYVDLWMEHSGISNVRLDGQVYQFRHYNQSTRNAITWKSRYEPVANILSPTNPIAANDSLLRSLLPGLNTADVLLYSRPSAWADLRIWRTGQNNRTTFGLGQSNAPITITKVTLQVFYDFANRSSSSAGKNLEVLVAQVDDSLGLNQVKDAMLPYFIVSNPDQNGRQDAQGRFLRMYRVNTPSSVQVTAQDLYGSLGFQNWTDEYGDEIGDSPTVTISTTYDRTIFANYVSLLPVPITMSRTDGLTLLSWQGGVGIKLQWRSCLRNSCPWQDVPGTEGLSSFSITPSMTGESYFRLIRVR